MSWNLKIYNLLVNEVPGIREKYHNYRDNHINGSRLKPWIYLAGLNFQYHILHRKSVGELSAFSCDEKIQLRLETPESLLNDYGTPKEFAERLMKYKVISFDVFDTLVFRPFKVPTDIFYFVGKELKYPEFKKIRVQAEMNAREKKLACMGHNEVSFDEIWDQISLVSGIASDMGKAIEWSYEKKFCFANPFFLEVIRILKEHKKTIIVCSDMYLGSDYIKELLSVCGFPEFDEYFVSSDFGKSKSDGKLYLEVKKRFGDERLVHIGDNPYSDVAQAQKNGIDAIYYANVNSVGNKYRASDMSPITASVYGGIVNQYLHNGMNKKTIPYEFGFVYGGLLVTGYCQFIHCYAKEHNIDKLLFLSRDGDILYKAYKIMYPEEASKCEYVLWSRLAAAKLCAGYYKYHYFARMIDYKVNLGYKLEEIFETMDLSDMSEGFYNQSNGRFSEKSVLDKRAAGQIKKYLEENWDTVLLHYKQESDEGKDYYSKILSDCSSALAIDAGWMGSGAVMLDHMINKVWNLNCKITGMLAGTLSGQSLEYEASEGQLLVKDLVSFGFSSSANRDIWKIHDASKGHNLIVELLLSSDKPSFRGFKKDSSSTYLFNDSKEKIDSRSVQTGILDFVNLFKKYTCNEIIISGRDAFAPIMVLYKSSKWIERLINETGINTNVE